MGRTIAIGDIHGCSRALDRLLTEIAPGQGDLIVTLGDYIDWGPDSRGVIERLIGLSSRCRLVALLGNHEEMLLAALESGAELRSWLQFGGEETLNSYVYTKGSAMIPEDHVGFVRGCRDCFESEGHIFVHANYDPGSRWTGSAARSCDGSISTPRASDRTSPASRL